ncbi:hypothetical protein IW261DRAFT_1564508 [Armillaria novae-zelandiae]|uniref:Uncharacterized protein n=1 Tax=Armillaria novae-zelandiae TaxID=153914 RepID=A0AA39P810_9AGAR|nr:hypothetical protein IW261DRAFT_1564508 [Armillaria novae-zelandiae]
MTPNLTKNQTIELSVALPAAFLLVLFTALMVHANRDCINELLHEHDILIPLQPRPTRRVPSHYQPTAPATTSRALLGAYPKTKPRRSQTQHARRRSTPCGDTSSDEFPLHKGAQTSAAKEYGRELWTRFHSPTPPPAYTQNHPGRVERPTVPRRGIRMAPELIRDLIPWPALDPNSDSSGPDVFDTDYPGTIRVQTPEPTRLVPVQEPKPEWLQLIDHELFDCWSPDRLWPELAPVDRDLLGPIRVEAWTLRREDIKSR